MQELSKFVGKFSGCLPMENWLFPKKIDYRSEKTPGTACASALVRCIRIILRFLACGAVYSFPAVQNITHV
jgi:hypothetical protein